MGRKNLLITLAIFLFISLTFSLALFLDGKEKSSSVFQGETLGIENQLAQSSCTEPTGGCGTSYYWDPTICACVYSGGCTEPTGGCGGDSYWDPEACSCMPYDNTSTCTEPTGGCGTGYHWDSGYCICTPDGSTQCSEPEGGCGTDHYWDSATCSCVYSGSCSEPSGGCGTGWYWDSTLCSCKVVNVTSTCSPPSSGCGSNYYWDSSACSCKISQTTICNPPSQGCGTDHYWDSYTCSCKASCSPPPGGCEYDYYWDYGLCACRSVTSCSPPAAGCGADYYWDSYYCSCKTYQGATTTTSCLPPSAGCGNNYYWDSYSCNCKQYPTNYGCYEPTGGCGTGWYWDENACICKSSTDDQIYYTTYDLPAYTQDQNFDRLAYESYEKIRCVKSILTPTEYERLRFLVPSTSKEQDEIHALGEKVKSCWGYSQDKVGIPQQTSLPVDGEACVINAIGEPAYRQIYRGERAPTHEEHLKFEKCYGQLEESRVNYVTDSQFIPKTVDDCLKSVLKGDLYNQIKSGKTEVPLEYRKKVDRCFGVNPYPFKEGSSYKVPSEVEGCLRDAVGEERFNQIKQEGSEPTRGEKEKAEACFARINKIQKKFLPPAAEEVPFLESDPNTIDFAEFNQDKKEVRGQTFGGKVVFKGKGPANSQVTIYIYSEPIVVATKTNENGEWVYELNKPLKGEKHVAYATVRKTSGEIVRSSVFNFEVLASEDVDLPQFLDESETNQIPQRFILYALGLILIGVFAVFILRKFGYKRAKLPEVAKLEGPLVKNNLGAEEKKEEKKA